MTLCRLRVIWKESLPAPDRLGLQPTASQTRPPGIAPRQPVISRLVRFAICLPCLLHTYAVPIPSGRAAYPSPRCGPWIRPVLIKHGYNPDRDGPAILTTISDRFCELLHAVHGACVEVVDLVPIVRKSDWRDELHLHAAGWRRCAREFQRVVQTIPLLATLVEPVERRQLPQPARELISQQRTVAV